MSDWNELATTWRAQAVTEPIAPDVIAREATRAALRGRAWRWSWWLVQATLLASLAMTVDVWWRAAPPGTRWIVTGLSATGLAVWFLSRGRMRKLIDRPTLSALDHLQAERARAAAIPWFVAMDFAVYALLAALLGWITWAWGGGQSLLGVDWGTPDPAGLATAWLLLAAAVGYDVARLVRSRRRRRQLDELLAALARDPGS